MLHINTKTSEIYLIYVIDLNKWVLETSVWNLDPNNFKVWSGFISDESVNVFRTNYRDKVLYAPLKIGDRKLVFGYGKFD